MICETLGIDYTSSDKVDHAAGGLVIGAVSGLTVDGLMPHSPEPLRFVVAWLPALIAGAGKEWYDHAHPAKHDCDFKDFASTALGGAAGVGLVIRLRF